MVHIVGELLDHARHPRQPTGVTALKDVFEDALETVAAKAQAAQVETKITLGSTPPRVRSQNLYQVFCNIIRNAYEAMPEGGTLTMAAQTTAEGMLEVRFEDSGSGIAEQDLKTVFDPFFTTKDAGTGLGLAVCRDIIHSLGGDIAAKSNPPGGTTIVVSVPLESVT